MAKGVIHARQPLAVRESFSATSVDGDITVDFQDPTAQRIEATSGDGDVVLGLAGDGPFLVKASTEARHGVMVVRVPETLDPKRAVSTVIARSATGDVTVDERN
ncbi:DUF4097 family beta strand repeat-containing protein [Mycolicibacterium confluentis]|uniref:Uncharacterized protein n=1 Tax=Mycolicibacterium confluentis TaxID=28047 RepID=A0A7I7XTH2_9MYCO|nr:hypothetical protein [Mycolicibacterium confluentis]MCV7321131.1 hypothetical protein [Mycolicibacterium confluentis]ORV21272.1 hypothetical protein AWB99_27095 [Mycolicibacterium confluentis]BBZ32393.1 hypothetical protein MCNF_09980 [Mycolicibacterium confluentis]